MLGTIGGMCIAQLIGYILQETGSYVSIFILAGMAYLIALFFVQTLTPRLERARV
jgi:ACS family hexuronate transporter-like MFS transporter